MAAALGVVGAMLLLAPLKGLVAEAGGAAGEELMWQTRLLALCLLAFAVALDGLHQVLAVARAGFFWGADVLGEAEDIV
ncbi:unnamed protein product [Prorocentrum cordatum]|uniref:Uncharacterized protein n=1 Tax=Prorocentrum cordatum TaxID=2364126 RepID=A0ABN9V3J7_9DINO|nr:unnamed protein product [Polarella glacialis]